MVDLLVKKKPALHTRQPGSTRMLVLECVADGVRQKHGLIRYLANSS